ncbi:hypothetical protein HBI56_063140 [Parastagonospora nodorum]|uniref:Heterokaryon incompatibility domain-containing protein n=2 Tax=Phaeosphaeria nodorum (strain SN15 / ATCC MYA-4574 / FGSC 10173) TaxID=321614 RepID=A0A7U2F3B0_PHANO|nr:hypothetical protein HBH56_197660 [Parastagonospora nodorum]QRC97627.1 hypothetical protein JI435_085990 [Parastagonospora nodorum SN15]KAH3924570.1 hypothetical protein HBH54_190620 [Parastagonospora nodorum]KAH3941948.1 hypothetical protein HBH53_194730 [Parastagonospora nodorum]KAH3957404.1 hypothetical protein HBH51_225840 [Parastagonospora nodorum]
MILIDTKTLALHVRDYADSNQDYAILSHTWGPAQDEVTYEEMLVSPKDRPERTLVKPGYSKIVETCARAASSRYKLPYAWIDTCCINKASSAELSEAINSMFRYYKEAVVCFAYLADVTDSGYSFNASRWFRRGWTLQELIAPKDLVFYGRRWDFRGTKATMAGRITEITGIPDAILKHEAELSEIPVAQRFSWASERKTTREEDVAYSLLGIFDINMAMLYGEGSKAFIRLQEQILSENADDSIFLWNEPFSYHKLTGILATHPKSFRQMRSIIAEPSFRPRDFHLTNRGVRLKLGLAWDDDTGLAIFPVKHSLGTAGKPAGVYLRRVGTDLFVRARPQDCPTVKAEVTYTEFTAVKSLTGKQATTILDTVMRVVKPADVRITRVVPQGLWDPASQFLHATHTGAILGYLEFKKDPYPPFAFIFFFRNGHWSATVVKGEEWLSIQKSNFYSHYKHNLDELRYFDTMGDARMSKIERVPPNSKVLTVHMRVARGTGRPHLEIQEIERKGRTS